MSAAGELYKVAWFETVAEAIRGKPAQGPVFGGVQFLPNGQMQPHYVMFKVVDGKNAKLETLK
jgi:branched-chain amino acid transport system substrate-binding protein